MPDVIVIGGGAAGMMAAYTAQKNGADTWLFEKNERMGRKLAITGKGRCNVTNNCSEEEFFQNIPTNPKFLFGALHRFSPQDTMCFFEEQGVSLKTERGKRVFPKSDRAADIVSALEGASRSAGVRFLQETVTEIRETNGKVSGVACSGKTFDAPKVILATGGKSYPQTGSDGSGYALARQCGHTVLPLRPSLVPLVSKDEGCADMQGLSLRNVTLTLRDKTNGKILFQELGEMLFTHFGMSGPLVLSASSHLKEIVPGKYEISIDCKPGLNEKQLDARILRDFSEFSSREFANSLEKLLPRKLIPIIIERSEILPLKRVNQISHEERQSLIRLIKDLTFSVDGFRPIEEAIVTSGGVSTKEISPKTMESKRLAGLYFAGEVIDVDGYTGGFNLQIAFSTGFAAGTAAAQ